MTFITPITLILHPAASSLPPEKKNSREITLPPELLQEMKPARPLNAQDFGLLCAPKEVLAGACSIAGSCKYIVDIIDHPAFERFAEKVVGSQPFQTVKPLIAIARERFLEFQYLTACMQSNPSETAKVLLERCSNDHAKACYLPGGWLGMHGQMVVIKAKKTEGSTVTVSILDRSESAYAHTPVEKSSLKGLASLPYSVDLESPSGKQLFQEWANLLFSSRPKDKFEFSQLDFYGRLLAYATGAQESDLSTRVSKSRLYSQSPAAAIISMFADVFHEQGASIEAHRSFVLVLKLFALIQESSLYEHSERNHQLFQEAISRTLVRAAKVGPESCNSQLIEAECEKMRTKLLAARHAHLQTEVSGNAMPGNAECRIPRCESRDENPFSTSYRDSVEQCHFTSPASPQDLTKQLEGFIDRMNRYQYAYIDLRSF
ncbi:MAG: hypothetical protein JSS12_11675, partial [Verrucomicrobia bacterium]|nr:hypothetical protein [Verrucomicrobiota bacterium]